uniref:Uncharacterized protein n=1 Tax=Cannabis sativa TaxID=3483 RepID=A0A803QPW1_CANSA
MCTHHPCSGKVQGMRTTQYALGSLAQSVTQEDSKAPGRASARRGYSSANRILRDLREFSEKSTTFTGALDFSLLRKVGFNSCVEIEFPSRKFPTLLAYRGLPFMMALFVI